MSKSSPPFNRNVCERSELSIKPESLFSDSGSGFFEEGVTHPSPSPALWDALRRGVDNSESSFLYIRKRRWHKLLINLQAIGKNLVGRGKNPVNRSKK